MSTESYKSVDAISAASYLATLGADTHIPYTDGGYANLTNVINNLKYLGIDQVRDGISNGAFGAAPLSSFITLAKAGIHFTFCVSGASNSDLTTTLALINKVEAAVPGSITAIEGPNEINNQPVDYNGQTGLAGAVALQRALYADVQSDKTLAGVPVDYFTGYNAGDDAKGPDPSKTSGLANYDNQHPYPNYGEAPAFWVSRSQALGNTMNPDAPAVFTETGYTTNQVNTTVQQVYTLDLLMDAAKEGISKTYLYELMDAYAPGSPQGDPGYGLFDYKDKPKPVAVGIHNLTTLLKDSDTNFKTKPFSYSLSGLPSDGNSMVIEKSNGTYVLVVWAEPQIWNNTTGTEIAAPNKSVTVSFPTKYGSIKFFDPTKGTFSIGTTTDKSSVSFTLTDHPILIELSNPKAAAAAAQDITPQLSLATHLTPPEMNFIPAVSGTNSNAATVSQPAMTEQFGMNMRDAFGRHGNAAALNGELINFPAGKDMIKKDMANPGFAGNELAGIAGSDFSAPFAWNAGHYGAMLSQLR